MDPAGSDESAGHPWLGSLCSTDETQTLLLAVGQNYGAGQGQGQVTSIDKGLLVGIDREAVPEASQGPRPVSPGRKVKQGKIPFHHLPSKEEEEDGWGQGGGRRWLPFSVPSPSLRAFSMSLQSVIWCGGQKGSYQRQPEI